MGVDGLWSNETGADGAGSVVHLGLGQVQRILSLDGPTAHIVAYGISDDLALVRYKGQLRLGDVPCRVRAYADGLKGAEASLGGGFQEQLRPFGRVDFGVDIGCVGLSSPLHFTALVRDAGGPNLWGIEGPV